MYKILISFFSIFLISWTCFLHAETKTWTSSAGSKMDAEIIDYSNRIVILKSSEGTKITLPIDKLIPSDQSFVKQWANQKKALKTTAQNHFSSRNDTPKTPELNSGMAELLPSKLLDYKGKKVSSSALAGKIVGFYFSAHWCPPCRAFTPSLVEFRDKNNNDFEVVFVSSDKSPDAQMDYMKETNMKWYTLPHRSDDANMLAQKYGVRGIPALIIVSPNGEVISKNGRGEVGSNPSEAIKNWKKSS